MRARETGWWMYAGSSSDALAVRRRRRPGDALIEGDLDDRHSGS